MLRLSLIPFVVLTACTGSLAPPAVPTGPAVAPAATLNPSPPPPPPPSARTVNDFDTTSDADRAEAVTVSATEAGDSLGTTLATLGAPTEPGIWLKTPLVTALRPGRVIYEGRTINVELRPSGGDPGSGSQISLAAMRLLEAPLTGILELEVIAVSG